MTRYAINCYAVDWKPFENYLNSKSEELYKEALTRMEKEYDNAELYNGESSLMLPYNFDKVEPGVQAAILYVLEQVEFARQHDYPTKVDTYRQQILRELIFEGKITVEPDYETRKGFNGRTPACGVAFQQVLLTLFSFSEKFYKIIEGTYSTRDDEPISELDRIWLPPT